MAMGVQTSKIVVRQMIEYPPFFDMCFMSIRDYGEVGGYNRFCAICVEQWEALY